MILLLKICFILLGVVGIISVVDIVVVTILEIKRGKERKMFKTNKLRGRIVEKYGTASRFAQVVGSTPEFVSKYLNGKTTLTQTMMNKWISALEISDNEIADYFFVKEVHETE